MSSGQDYGKVGVVVSRILKLSQGQADRIGIDGFKPLYASCLS